MQSHRSWQPFNVNAGVKGEAEGFAANQSLTVQGWDKLTLLHMMVASHRVLLHTRAGDG